MTTEMKYCMACGTKLITKHLENEGEIPYCESCGEFRFPVFSTAVSMIVLNPTKDKILLIKQYGRDAYILVAGYVNKGEDAESTVCREIKEELGLTVTEYHFNRSRYFSPSNTLMLNFTVVVDAELPNTNDEVDACKWFSFDEARENIMENSLAKEFLVGYLDKIEDSIS